MLRKSFALICEGGNVSESGCGIKWNLENKKIYVMGLFQQKQGLSTDGPFVCLPMHTIFNYITKKNPMSSSTLAYFNWDFFFYQNT